MTRLCWRISRSPCCAPHLTSSRLATLGSSFRFAPLHRKPGAISDYPIAHFYFCGAGLGVAGVAGAGAGLGAGAALGAGAFSAGLPSSAGNIGLISGYSFVIL